MSTEEDDVEEVFVFARFEDFTSDRFLSECSTVFLHDYVSKPSCIADGFKFKGQHQDSVGSLLLVRSDGEGEAIICNKETSFKLVHIPDNTPPVDARKSSENESS